MRSSKSRSRSKTNRPRTLGNIINRVFDSSGPDGKVRGTPQQIIEKYQMLARDAQLSNDRVAAENFLQHAEHYTRLLAEAMREMAAEQELRGQNYVQNNGQNSGQNGTQQGGHNNGQNSWQNRGQDGRGNELGDGDQPYAAQHDMMDGDASSVDFPEQDRGQQPAQQAPRQFQPRQDRPNENRQNTVRQNDNRQNNRPRDERPRDDRPRDDRPRENQPRENQSRDSQPRDSQPRDNQPRDSKPRDDRPRDNQPRDSRPRDDARTAPAPHLRFEDGASEERPTPAPIFESPAALVAQLQDAPAAQPIAAAIPVPKPRAPRAKKPAVEPIADGKQDV